MAIPGFVMGDYTGVANSSLFFYLLMAGFFRGRHKSIKTTQEIL